MLTHASRYNSVVPNPEGGYLLYNQLSGSLLALDEVRLAEYHTLAAAGTGEGPFYSLLREGQFLVDAARDERQIIQEAWDHVVMQPEVKALTIVPTDRCNLGCTYCYEAKPAWEKMSETTMAQVEQFAATLVTATPTKKLSVIWFGGEPTLHLRCIERLTASFLALCNTRGILYQTFLVTNGTTLTDAVLDRLRRCQITRMQVTLDGLGDAHDAKRPYLRDVTQPTEAQKVQQARIGLTILDQAPRTPRSSFAVILDSVRRARSQGFEIKLRMNVDHANKAGVKALFRQLQAEGLLQKHASGGQVLAYSAAIFEGCSGCSPDQMTKAEHAAFEAELRAEGLAQDTWRFANLKLTGATCTANMNWDFVITQRGELTKCWHHATDSQFLLGTVADVHLAERGSRASDPLIFNPLDDPECYACPVLPLCMGGCKATNQFPALGYRGHKDSGCHTARYTLPEHILAMYQLRTAHAHA